MSSPIKKITLGIFIIQCVIVAGIVLSTLDVGGQLYQVKDAPTANNGITNGSDTHIYQVQEAPYTPYSPDKPGALLCDPSRCTPSCTDIPTAIAIPTCTVIPSSTAVASPTTVPFETVTYVPSPSCVASPSTTCVPSPITTYVPSRICVPSPTSTCVPSATCTVIPAVAIQTTSIPSLIIPCNETRPCPNNSTQ